ncbi:MAG TPA: alpha/beta fold hydrolase [Ktedonosporobacter sp.]|jgi:pimeloyl-ACP methyl ester carboxylesterase|nr:alpha/beta fold hydrolase [Ktedonosporobacter sp.]
MRKLSTHHVLVDDVPAYYQVVGEGEPVVLVHGLSGSMRWWVRNVPALAQHYQVYVLDLPGFGLMRRLRGRFTIEKALTWLIDWMEAVGLRRAHFIGHSMGGYICMLLAARRPELVESMVLVSPAAIPQARSVYGYFIPLINSLVNLKPSFLPILLHDALRAGPVTLLQALQDIVLAQAHEIMSKIAVRTLIVWGDRDFLVPPKFGHVIRQELPNARLLKLTRAGHIGMYDQYREFNAAVLAFLGGECVGE